MIKLPEPDTHCEDLDTGEQVWSYSKDLLQQAIRDALEEAAKECESQWSNAAEKLYGMECAAAIRALKEAIQ